MFYFRQLTDRFIYHIIYHLMLDAITFRGTTISSADSSIININEGVVVDVGEHRHHHLTVHSVRQPAVPGDAVAEVLDLERALEPRREEPACYRGQGRQTLVSPEKFSLTTK